MPSDGLLVPGRVWHEPDGVVTGGPSRAVWVMTGSEVRKPPPDDLLHRFARLHRRSDEQVVRFVMARGSLGICRHGMPWQNPYCLCGEPRGGSDRPWLRRGDGSALDRVDVVYPDGPVVDPWPTPKGPRPSLAHQGAERPNTIALSLRRGELITPDSSSGFGFALRTQYWEPLETLRVWSRAVDALRQLVAALVGYDASRDRLPPASLWQQAVAPLYPLLLKQMERADRDHKESWNRVDVWDWSLDDETGWLDPKSWPESEWWNPRLWDDQIGELTRVVGAEEGLQRVEAIRAALVDIAGLRPEPVGPLQNHYQLALPQQGSVSSSLNQLMSDGRTPTPLAWVVTEQLASDLAVSSEVMVRCPICGTVEDGRGPNRKRLNRRGNLCQRHYGEQRKAERAHAQRARRWAARSGPDTSLDSGGVHQPIHQPQ